MKTVVRRTAPLLLILALIAAVYFSGLYRYVSLDVLRERHQQLRDFVDAHFWTALALYVAAYALATTAAIPGALFLTLTGGFLFGTWIGGSVTAVAATAGAIFVYYAVRSVLGGWLRERAAHSGGTMARLRAGFDRNAFSYILTLRLIPVVPFVLINIAAGLAAVPIRAYAAATVIGILPATFIYSAVGASLGEVFDRGETPNLKLIFEPFVLFPLLGLAFLSLALPPIVRAIAGRKAPVL
ncbi:VTT domain-containing protein [Caulobacter sp. 17J65-9]|uniref:TVP38/TMEM64 family protein n=1 Tax=Caulobacter sp. 17J65-9 TaxID=2709382 RepID=UPI0013CC9A22|nr:VTT domain-containing protein [Caulobacter sp. 17J65-9]NEX95094.1 TVP38/TMEM64 family protein [Caulobacter sp. 17J65-9]